MSNYNWSINITQGIIAFLEGLAIGMKAKKSAVLAGSIVVASLLPASMAGGWEYNEELWETVIATILGGAVLTGAYDGSFMHNAIKAFIIDTSSQCFTDEIYNSFILGGKSNPKQLYRAAYPEASFVNKITLG